jgi:hypothetical protein
VERKLSRCHDVDDLRDVGRRMLPRAVFDNVDRGANEEISLTAAAGSEAGVHRSIELMIDQLPRMMQLCGVNTLPDLRKHADEVVVSAIATSGARPTDRRRLSGDGRWTRKVAP